MTTKTRAQISAKFLELAQEARDTMNRYFKMINDSSRTSDVFGSYGDDISLFGARLQVYREAEELVSFKSADGGHLTRERMVEWFHDRILEGAAYAERSTSASSNQAKRDLLAARTQLYRDLQNGRYMWAD